MAHIVLADDGIEFDGESLLKDPWEVLKVPS